ncbi:hypothetical protein CK936_24255 [Streptomyces albireticuli]|uniref:Uncharacterized protein n=1 Tax=Streptomyces albireticuli TaxID=1940 RepID=A0A2A2D4P9_9ACTN|nr:hypothetical protein CK936_24255 [Streptomyces albireticuli]
MRPSSVICVPVMLPSSKRQNDTGEITSVPIRASQAEICYWAPYSLCGTKAKQKVPKTIQVRTHRSAHHDRHATSP